MCTGKSVTINKSRYVFVQEQIAAQSQTLSDLNRDLDSSRQEISRLDGACAEKDEQINRLREELDNTRHTVEVPNS